MLLKTYHADPIPRRIPIQLVTYIGIFKLLDRWERSIIQRKMGTGKAYDRARETVVRGSSFTG